MAATAQRLHDEAQAATVSVWPENWHAVQLFMALATQWHWRPVHRGARRCGLRYEAIPAVLPAVRHAVPRRWRQAYPALLGQLQHLEDEALAEIDRATAQS